MRMRQMRPKTLPAVSCHCADDFTPTLCDSYESAKHLLNIGKHPAFIGRGTFEHCRRNGGALLFLLDEQPIAVSMVNPRTGVLLALNVSPQHRGHGLGAAIVNFLMPNWCRVIEHKVKWFQHQGYRRIGSMKTGIKFKTEIMVRTSLIALYSRLETAHA